MHSKKQYYIKPIKSAALGQNEFKIGFHRNSIDGWFFFRGQYLQRRYTLGHTAKLYLHVEGKDPVGVAEINCAARSDASPDDVAKLVAYCARDTDLTARLVAWGGATQQLIGQSRASGLEVRDIMRSGKGIIVFTCFARFAWERGFLINEHKSLRFAAQEKYAGGRVLLPEPGTCNWPVAVLDFASLYPSIIDWRNYCYSTFLGRITKEEAERLQAAGLPVEEAKASLGTYYFVRHLPEDPSTWPPNAKCRGVLGLLPELEAILKKGRKKAKKNKAAAEFRHAAARAAISLLRESEGGLPPGSAALDKARQEIRRAEQRLVAVPEGKDDYAFRMTLDRARLVAELMVLGEDVCAAEVEKQEGLATRYDAEQKALKVIMNTIYGVTGGKQGHLPCLPVADAICSMGAQMIDNCANLVKVLYGEGKGWKYGADFPMNVVYGDTDSVMVQIPVKPGDFAEAILHLQGMERTLTQMFQLECKDEKYRFYDMADWLRERGLDHFHPRNGKKPDRNNAVAMEFETLMFMFTSLADVKTGLGIKKKYCAGGMISDPNEDHGRQIDAGVCPLTLGKRYVKGIQTQRRDAPKGVNEVLLRCMDVVLMRDPIETIRHVLASGKRGPEVLAKMGRALGDPTQEEVMRQLHSGLTKIVENRMPLQDYVITTSVKATDQYACTKTSRGNLPSPPDALILKWLADKRVPGSGEDPGERTGLVYRKRRDPKNYDPPPEVESPFARSFHVDPTKDPVRLYLERPDAVSPQNPIDRKRYCRKAETPLVSLFFPLRQLIKDEIADA